MRAFARDLDVVRRRVAEEYVHERASHAARRYGAGWYDDEPRYGYGFADEDAAVAGEGGYEDFKLTAAAFRVWVRHTAALRALRAAREAAVENWMISVSFWECNALKRALARWRGRRNVMQLHALRFWYGETLRGRFAQWREYAYRVRKNKIEEKENFKRAVALWSGKNLAGCFLRWKMTLERRREFAGGCLLLASKSRRARILARGPWRRPNPPRSTPSAAIFKRRRDTVSR